MRAVLLLLALVPTAARAGAPEDAESLVKGLKPDDVALKARIFPDAYRYFAAKAFAARDPRACGPMRAFEHTGEIDSADGAAACERRYWSLAVAYALKTGEPDAEASCAKGLRHNSLGPDADKVDRICALLLAARTKPAKELCSGGPRGLAMSEEACLQRLGERRGDRAACGRIQGMSGTSQRRELCEGMAAFVEGAGDPARCGASEPCRLYAGAASAVLEERAAALLAAAKAPPSGRSEGPVYLEPTDVSSEDGAAFPRTVEEALARLDATNSDEPARGPQSPPDVVALGRTLFFDKLLSKRRDLACSSCHLPEKGWSDGLPRARGAGGKELSRRTLSLLKVGYYDSFMWDGRAKSLEEQALLPLTSKDEMGMDDLAELERRLSASPEYRAAFRKAFGGEPTAARTTEALAAFVRKVASLPGESRFERFRREKKGLSESERRGFLVYMGKGRCVACHLGLKLTYAAFENSGVADPPGHEDLGRYAVVPAPRARGAFRTPTLFDAAETGPYMHNGSLKTLADVVEFYDRGGDVRGNQSLAIKPLKLTAEEKDDLVAFLGTLSKPAGDYR